MPKDRPQCGLILEDSGGRILLQLRDDKPEIPYPDCWGTFGGQVEVGETSEAAIVREIKEELGYVLRDFEYIGDFPHDGYSIHMFRKVDPNVKIEDLVVTEGQRGQFFTVEELADLQYAFNCGEIVAEYAKRFLSVVRAGVAF